MQANTAVPVNKYITQSQAGREGQPRPGQPANITYSVRERMQF